MASSTGSENHRGERLADRSCECGRKLSQTAAKGGNRRERCHYCNRLTEFIAPPEATVARTYAQRGYQPEGSFQPGRAICWRHEMRDAQGHLVHRVRASAG